MGWEPVSKCVDASKKHSQTTRRLLDEDRRDDKRVFTGMHEILKTKIGKLEDAINTNGKALGDAIEGKLILVESKVEEANMNGKVLEGKIAVMEGDMKEMKGEMKEANMNGKVLGDASKALEGRIAVMEGDMKEMKGDMKEMKDLLMQLIGINNVETKTKE